MIWSSSQLGGTRLAPSAASFTRRLVGPHAPHGLRLGEIHDLEGKLRVVAADDEQPGAVGGEQDVVGPMLTAAGKRTELFHAVGHVVAVGIGDPIEAAAGASVTDDIEGVERPEQSLGAGDFGGDSLDDRLAGAVERGRRDPDEPLIPLIAGDQPSLGIGRQRDPGAEFLPRHDEQTFDRKPVEEGERIPGTIRPALGRGTLAGRGGGHFFRLLSPVPGRFRRIQPGRGGSDGAQKKGQTTEIPGQHGVAFRRVWCPTSTIADDSLPGGRNQRPVWPLERVERS